jgi:hypothetical protein
MLRVTAYLYLCRSERQTMLIADTALAVINRDEPRLARGTKCSSDAGPVIRRRDPECSDVVTYSDVNGGGPRPPPHPDHKTAAAGGEREGGGGC